MQNPLAKPLNQLHHALEAMKPDLLAKIGAQAKIFTNDNFRLQGFQGDVFEPWVKRNPDKDPGRAILVGKGTAHLKNSIHIIAITADSVSIGTSIPYAQIHNEGGSIRHPYREVTMHYKKVSGKLRLAKLTTIGDQMQASEFRRSSVSNHVTNMPRRHYLGPSPVLDKQIIALIRENISSTFKIIQ